MQRIGMIGSVGALDDMYAALTMGRANQSLDEVNFPYRKALLGLDKSIVDYHSGEGSLDAIQARLKQANEGVSAYIAAFPGNAREELKEQRQYVVDRVNKAVVEYLRAKKVRGPYGRVHLSDTGKLLFRLPGSDRYDGQKDLGAYGLAEDTSSNNAIMLSLVGAGLGYALAPKNRGMAAGVGAVAGYIGSTLLK